MLSTSQDTAEQVTSQEVAEQAVEKIKKLLNNSLQELLSSRNMRSDLVHTFKQIERLLPEKINELEKMREALDTREQALSLEEDNNAEAVRERDALLTLPEVLSEALLYLIAIPDADLRCQIEAAARQLKNLASRNADGKLILPTNAFALAHHIKGVKFGL